MIRRCRGHPTGVPDGYHSVNPYIVVAGVESLIDFLRDVFDGIERGERELSADGTIGHAEVEIGDSVVMLSEATPAYPLARASTSRTWRTWMPSSASALAAGAHHLEPTQRRGVIGSQGFHDPFDNRWWVATVQQVT